MKKQTAVEWLFLHLYENFEMKGDGREMDKILEQAKAMEKEQIMKAFSNGQETPINNPTLPHFSRDEYYNETYNN